MPHIKCYWLRITAVILCLSSIVFAQDKSQNSNPASEQSAIEKFAAVLIDAKTDEDRNELLAAHKEMVTVELQRTLMKEGDRLRLREEYKQALTIFQLSRNIAEKTGDKIGVASALNGIGNINNLQGNYGTALEYYLQSLSLCEELENREAIANLFNNIGAIYGSQGNFPQALEYFQKSLAINEELKEEHSIARLLRNIGIIQRIQGNNEQALENQIKSLAIWEKLKDKTGIADSLNSIGNIFHAQCHYEKALEYYQKSLLLCRELNNKVGIASAMSNIGDIYRRQGNYEQALDYFQTSLKLSEELGDKEIIATALNNIGLIHHLAENYSKALELYGRSLAIRKELQDKAGLARTLSNMGGVYCLQGQYVSSLEHFEKSLALGEELKDKDLIVGTINNISFVQFSLGAYEKAVKSAEQATSYAKQTNNEECYWRSCLAAGAAYRALNQPDQARQALEESIRAIEIIRSQLAGGEQAGQTFFEDKIAPYHEMVDLLVSQNNFPEALAYAERAKARVILDVLQSGRVDITKAMSQQEREQEKNLNNQIASLNKKLYAEKQQEKPDEARIADIDTKLNKSRLELEAFQTSLYAAHPELKVKRVEVQPITLDEARDLIPDNRTALLEFVVAERKTHLFVLTRAQQKIDLKIFTIDVNRKDLAERVNSFRDMIARKELGFRKPGHELYDLLLKPAEEILKSKTTLIIVPESSLWELPFQVLQTPQNRYLLQDCALFYSPSLTALRETVKLKPAKRTASSPALLAFGNPALKTQNGGSKEPALLDMKLDPLPAAEEQVKALAKLYGLKQSKFYIGAEAREERVKAEAGDYRVLQFATHGILNNASPMYSHLVLSQTEEKSDEDGLLEAREIAEMDLQADMAVLAACETARGRVGAGEGVIGLSWALFVAGCPATVVSQWKVEDEATKELMLEFHRLLKSGAHNSRAQLSKAEALRTAALNMMRAGMDAHPFYWAGFVIVGNGR